MPDSVARTGNLDIDPWKVRGDKWNGVAAALGASGPGPAEVSQLQAALVAPHSYVCGAEPPTMRTLGAGGSAPWAP